VFDSGIALYPFGNGLMVGLFGADLKDSFVLNSKGFIRLNPRLVQSTPGEMN
jgi:hypothetical protein